MLAYPLLFSISFQEYGLRHLLRVIVWNCGSSKLYWFQKLVRLSEATLYGASLYMRLDTRHIGLSA